MVEILKDAGTQIIELLVEHDVDLEKERVAFAFHDSIAFVSLDDDKTLNILIRDVDRFISVPADLVGAEEE